MIVAGTYLNDTDVTALAEKLRESGFADHAGRLEAAYQLDAKLFHLSADDSQAFMSSLDDCPDELQNLRASLQDQLVSQGG